MPFTPIQQPKSGFKPVQGRQTPVFEPIPEPEKKGFLNKVAGLFGGEKIAQGLGQAIAQPEIAQSLNQTQANQGELQHKLMAAIRQNRAMGKDTSRLELALKKLTGDISDTGNNASDLLNPNKLTGKQIAGDALQLGTTIASFGTYGTAANAAKTGQMLSKAPTLASNVAKTTGFGKGALQGLKFGAAEGTVVGLSTGISQGLEGDKSIGDSLKSGLDMAWKGGITGGVVGGLVGGISGALRQKTLRDSILKKQEQVGLRPSLDDVVKQKSAIDPKFELIVKEAQKQGFKESDINFLSTVSDTDKPILQKMYNATVKAQSDPRQITRAGDILGESVIEQVNQVRNLNSTAGKSVDATAKALQGNIVDGSLVLQKADELLSGAGVTVDEAGGLNFGTSIFKKSPELQKQLQRALDDIPLGQIDAYELHKFKKSLYELVEYGGRAEGMTGTAERILKGIAASADEVLDTKFTDYNEANTLYKLTRDYIESAQGIAGKKVDFSTPGGAQAFGQALRSAFSNNKSRGNTLKFIEDTHLLSKQLGLSGSEKNLLDQAIFVNMLEETFGSEAATGMAGEISKALNKTMSIADGLRSPLKGAMNLAGFAAEKVQNITPEAKKQVLKSFLGNAVGVPAKTTSIGKPLAKVATKAKIKVPRAINGQMNAVVGAGAGIERDENGNIKIDSMKAALGILGVAGTTQLTTKNLAQIMNKVRRVHPEDRQVVINFLDNVRLKDKTNPQLELDARRLAEHYKINPNQPNSRLADALEKVVAAYDYAFKPKYKGDFNQIVNKKQTL